ncbi:hypothetical protein [Accumulibacter sp.]|uniref:hypothetical protein n=1 Tax=Accumulibacter sp. TaxID=2053492 RepID=UPI0025FABAC8|nr:hypothetical protein [Accumulibacter sp.]MCM8595781.1 hypothetical protein [Accumulibacter sp.]MCM8626502.1 hypothetical protein [Accumulibacter sp.]MDS4049929.1 hypothetical protein [Accumulibacter sp.]
MSMLDSRNQEQGASALTAAAREGNGVEQSSGADQRRRRMVRGAAALAPLVLTLRSGALAAASCTGVKVGSATVNSNATPPAGKINASNIAQGDVCVIQPLDACPNVSGKAVTTKIGVANYEPAVHVQQGDYWQCGKSGAYQGRTVAILSSNSLNSMGVG